MSYNDIHYNQHEGFTLFCVMEVVTQKTHRHLYDYYIHSMCVPVHTQTSALTLTVHLDSSVTLTCAFGL